MKDKDITYHLVTVEKHVGNYPYLVLFTDLGYQASFDYLVPLLFVASLTGKISELGM